MPRGRRPNPALALGEVLMWVLFVALLVPAGFVGWAIGHYEGGGTKTVTVSAAATTTAPTGTTSATTATTAPATTAPRTTSVATAPPAAAAGAAKGKAVYTSSGCGACHTFKAAGSSAKIGPDLDTKPAADAKKAHMALTAFVRESIVKPNAYISPGYPKGIMPTTFGTQLSKTQLTDLVSFIVGGK